MGLALTYRLAQMAEENQARPELDAARIRGPAGARFSVRRRDDHPFLPLVSTSSGDSRLTGRGRMMVAKTCNRRGYRKIGGRARYQYW